MIGLLIVFLKKDDGILTFGHFQVFHDTCFPTCTLTGAECISLESTCHTPSGECIDMNRNKKICLVFVGNLGTSI